MIYNFRLLRVFNGNLKMAGFNNMTMIDGIFESWRKLEKKGWDDKSDHSFSIVIFFNSICLFNNRNSIWFDRLMKI